MIHSLRGYFGTDGPRKTISFPAKLNVSPLSAQTHCNILSSHSKVQADNRVITKDFMLCTSQLRVLLVEANSTLIVP